MGGFYASMHFRTTNRDAVTRAVRLVTQKSGGAALVRPARGGWVTVYPSFSLGVDPEVLGRAAAASGVEHVIAFMVHDDSVLVYWYFRGGVLADYYNSCPDYFGTEYPEDMGAAGDAGKLEGLLDAGARARWAEIIRPRMIDGEHVGGEVPPWESARLEDLEAVLGVTGAVSSYEYLKEGEETEGTGPVAEMVEVG